MSEEWTIVESTNMDKDAVITDVYFLAKKERVMPDYEAVSEVNSTLARAVPSIVVCACTDFRINQGRTRIVYLVIPYRGFSHCLPPRCQIEKTLDGKNADFPEGRLTVTRRYLCFTRKVVSPKRVSQLLIQLILRTTENSLQ